MIDRAVLSKARDLVDSTLSADTSGHDKWHAERVAFMAKKLARKVGADETLCELAALLHDIPDEKRGVSEENEIGKLRKFLGENRVPENSISHIIEIISSMSFRGGNNPPMRTLEGKVVQDADMLDAIGAIGIARVFAYSGHSGRKMHNPEVPPRLNLTREEYRLRDSTAINHFYEKLLKLADLMNTEPARKIAIRRSAVMEEFLEEFFKEWNGGR